MQPLERTLRSQLERSVRQARRVGEQAARAALDALGVADASVPPHLDEDQRVLRRRLRAHARSLGDVFRNGGSVPEQLIAEVAYEHWHRMLFARFLAENDLLMYDGVAITLEECAELAAEEGGGSGWELAARLAAKLLPQVFRIDSPVLAIRLAPDDQRALEGLLAGLAPEVFRASDSLGWVYQFWQADAKERINQAEVKIGARELPAVTQLFTEPYMVQFLLHNSLGAWWVSRHPDEICPVDLTYLRRRSDGSPAAGRFEGWPQNLSEFRLLDPCCGSGHFLVAAFLMLVPMRMTLEGMDACTAVDAVLRENIHGLELDQRCVAIAAFALALEGWRYPNTGGYRTLQKLNVAWCGQPVVGKKDHWLALADGDSWLEAGMAALYDTFRDAPTLGSLIDPARSVSEDILTAGFDKVRPLLQKALQKHAGEEEWEETAIAALGLSETTRLLGQHYHLVITNVPYLSRGKQEKRLAGYCAEKYPRSKADLSTVFLERMLSLISSSGRVAAVMPQNWMYQPAYRQLRAHLIRSRAIDLVSTLGTGAFGMISGWVVNVLLGIFRTLENIPRVPDAYHAIDASEGKNAQFKAMLLQNAPVSRVPFSMIQNIPDNRILNEPVAQLPTLSRLADGVHGFGSKDSARFFRSFWEHLDHSVDWQFMQTTVSGTHHWDGCSQMVYWQHGRGILAELGKQGLAIPAGRMAWGKRGVAVSQMGALPVTIYSGEIFDKNVAVICPSDEAHLNAIWNYCSSPDFCNEVRKIDQALKVTNRTLVKVPFDVDHWTKVAAERYPHGLPLPYSEDPTQWTFHGHPCGSVVWDEEKKWTAHGLLRTDETVLQVAAARLLGHRWPAELDPAMELAKEQREWVHHCETLLPLADTDGIACIPPVRGEARAEERLLNLLAAAYGDAWSADTHSRLLASADHAGKSLESWLRDKFFAQHCKLFQQRPFIWQIWDGLRDGFSVLVNYHKLDRKNLETLIYTYLGDWIRNQRDDVVRGVDGAQEKLDAAEALQRRLEQILEGEAPYDIFVRWKPIEEQPIGWNPDLNDGVRLNIRPFLTVDDVGRKGAGILRDKPNIHWNKDRGKDVASAPWFHRFKGERINDHHLALAEKLRARE